jgi:methylmalonyl-CoA mutase N-terminal domain/subunit
MQVIDPWGGSYMMESLTDAVYQEAMAIIKEVCSARGPCPATVFTLVTTPLFFVVVATPL